jgi:type IV pilus assembly protein PilM
MSIIDSLVSSIKTGNKSANGTVGIDIGSSSIKVVELQDRKGVITLTTYGELQLGPYTQKPIGSSVTLTAEQEQQALVDVIRESAVQAGQAVFAMPLSSSFLTNVTIEAESDADVSAMVRVEARKVIPASLSEVTLDWAEVVVAEEKKATKEKDDTTVRRNILIAAIQNAALERFKILMQFTNMSQSPTEIESFSVLRGLYSADEKNVAIIDVGATSSKLYIVREGMLVRMYRVRAGGVAVTQNLAQELGVEFEEAESLKCSVVDSDKDYSLVQRMSTSVYSRAFREFTQVLHEYEAKVDLTLDNIYLCGGGSQFPGLHSQFRDMIDRDVVPANPFKKVAYPAFMQDALSSIGPSFTGALGAAMRAFE